MPSRKGHLVESWLVAVQGLRHRRAQTVVTVVVIVVLAAIAATAPWYARMVRDQTTAAAFAVGEPGGEIRIDSTAPEVPAGHVPDDPRLIDRVAGRDTSVSWQTATVKEPGEGGILSRDGLCSHVRLVDGACPTGPDEIAVSSADRDAWGMEVGAEITFQEKTSGEGGALTVVGVYEVTDPGAAYWYGLLPDGRSGYRDLEIPVTDQFLADPLVWQAFPGLGGESHLDLRVDGSQVPAADLPEVQDLYDDIAAKVRADEGAEMASRLPDAMGALDHSFTVAGRSIALTIGQLAAVGLVGLVLVSLLGVRVRRRDLGLQRLRGSSPARLGRRAALEWFLVALPGVVLGVVAAGLFAAVVRSTWLPSGRVLGPPWASLLTAAVVPVVGSLLVGLLTWRTSTEPIPALLRATEERAAPGRTGLAVLDVLLLAVVGSAVLVAVTSTESSLLVLLTPALLALAGAVLVSRFAIWLIGRRGQRWLMRRPAVGLAAVEVARGGGLRSVLMVSGVATALLVLTTQAALIGEHNRTHRAEVETGAPQVFSTTAAPVRVQEALDEIDPDREQATVVTSVGRPERGYEVLYVEPRAFGRIAHGTQEALPRDNWSAIAAPSGGETTLSGDRLRVRVDGELRSDQGDMQLWVTVAERSGTAHALLLGDLPAGDRAQVRTVRAPCAKGCRLLTVSFRPDGVTSLEADLSIEAGSDGRWTPVPLSADAFEPQLPDDDRYRLETAAGPRDGLSVDIASGGIRVELQSAWLSATLPVFVSDQMEAPIEDGQSIRTPDGDSLPIDIKGRLADAAPRALADTLIGDLTVSTRYGKTQTDPSSRTMLWVTATADVPALRSALAGHRVQISPLGDVADAQREHDNTAEALASQLNPIAAALVALLAAGCLVLTVASGRQRRTADLRALDLAGVPPLVGARATRWSLLVPVVAGVLIGSVAGVVGSHFAVRGLPIFADEEPAIHLQLGLHPWAVVAAVLAAAALLVVVLLLAARSLTHPSEESS